MSDFDQPAQIRGPEAVRRSLIDAAVQAPSGGNCQPWRFVSVGDLELTNPDADREQLELMLDEVVLRESGKLESLVWLVRIVSVVAPLMGLLGTVTGMIRTFQSITLFGAGDPRMMAGGISEALVTTMLGLVTAIPLVLLHAALANNTKKIVDTLDEQSAGLIAQQE